MNDMLCGIISGEDERRLRDYAHSKDLSARYYKATNSWDIRDMQTGKDVAKHLSYAEAYDFVDKYDW